MVTELGLVWFSFALVYGKAVQFLSPFNMKSRVGTKVCKPVA